MCQPLTAAGADCVSVRSVCLRRKKVAGLFRFHEVGNAAPVCAAWVRHALDAPSGVKASAVRHHPAASRLQEGQGTHTARLNMAGSSLSQPPYGIFLNSGMDVILGWLIFRPSTKRETSMRLVK